MTDSDIDYPTWNAALQFKIFVQVFWRKNCKNSQYIHTRAETTQQRRTYSGLGLFDSKWQQH